jgi:hypothetical protein
MSSGADLEIVYRIENAPLRTFPFPHLYVTDALPADGYAELLANLPPRAAMAPLAQARGSTAYPERFVMPLGGALPPGLAPAQAAFWTGFARVLLGGRLAHAVLRKFGEPIERQLQGLPDYEIFDEAMLVRDETRYALGPHTDSPKKLASLLFYLPADASQLRYGTSIYVPRDAQFTCPGTAHHDVADFERVATMPYAPNSLFAFPKGPASFHGVEPIREPGVARYLLLYDLRVRAIDKPSRDPVPGPSVPTVRFRLDGPPGLQ